MRLVRGITICIVGDILAHIILDFLQIVIYTGSDFFAPPSRNIFSQIDYIQYADQSLSKDGFWLVRFERSSRFPFGLLVFARCRPRASLRHLRRVLRLRGDAALLRRRFLLTLSPLGPGGGRRLLPKSTLQTNLQRVKYTVRSWYIDLKSSTEAILPFRSVCLCTRVTRCIASGAVIVPSFNHTPTSFSPLFIQL